MTQRLAVFLTFGTSDFSDRPKKGEKKMVITYSFLLLFVDFYNMRASKIKHQMSLQLEIQL